MLFGIGNLTVREKKSSAEERSLHPHARSRRSLRYFPNKIKRGSDTTELVRLTVDEVPQRLGMPNRQIQEAHEVFG